MNNKIESNKKGIFALKEEYKKRVYDLWVDSIEKEIEESNKAIREAREENF